MSRLFCWNMKLSIIILGVILVSSGGAGESLGNFSDTNVGYRTLSHDMTTHAHDLSDDLDPPTLADDGEVGVADEDEEEEEDEEEGPTSFEHVLGSYTTGRGSGGPEAEIGHVNIGKHKNPDVEDTPTKPAREAITPHLRTAAGPSLEPDHGPTSGDSERGRPGYAVDNRKHKNKRIDFTQVSTRRAPKKRKGLKGTKHRKYMPIMDDGRGFSNEYYIKRTILTAAYDRTTRPVRNDTTTTTVYVGMSLYHILDTNEKFQTLSALIAVRLRWYDELLTWDPDQFGGVDHIWVPAEEIWRPDIFINNFADDSFQDFMNTFAIVSSDGQVLWMFPAVVKTYCTLDVRHFPFDRQKCNIIFISWTFNGFKVNVTYNESEHNTVYYTPKNQEWYVDKISVTRHEKVYACCIEPYPDVTFSIHMTRRSLFYIINLIFPCLLIYGVSFLGFFLPVESGEKVNLEITILLALVVFLLIVGETLPPTPDAIPALGVLFGTTMLMVSIALVMSVIVTNIYLRKDSGTRVPAIFRKIFIRHKPRNSLSNKVTTTENHINETKLQDIEIDALSNQSEVETLTCRSRCARRSTVYRPSVEYDPTSRIAYEWQMLARCVDRLFFWVFLISSIFALVSMFAQIPSFNAT